ncbi:cupin domain-containing protein [Microbacter margulisiae]|uniref:Quercetin dioxygenase-like cupin family protein n=1 Tax=Microbacter margulisiae TaxID=1350067 RepID=A0A7W5DQA6_9PORP|nr:cupin domain-containing protein [Microbacter margulisiae]MBB3187092.1 quercetin dioxygenase-like cupin family protein [Microbacter margulisiae]
MTLGVRRQIMGYDGQVMMVKVWFQKGAEGYMHEHFHSQCSYVASGKFQVTVNGKMKVLSGGDGFYVEPDQLHGLICLEEGVVVDFFSPMRTDFLQTEA